VRLPETSQRDRHPVPDDQRHGLRHRNLRMTAALDDGDDDLGAQLDRIEVIHKCAMTLVWIAQHLHAGRIEPGTAGAYLNELAASLTDAQRQLGTNHPWHPWQN
jgi:hypothetical protein